MINLFGEEQPEYKKPIGIYQIFRARHRYRKALSDKMSFNRCKDCNYHKCFEHHNKTYHKCLLQGISNSVFSDIRISYVCDLFERREP